MKQGKEQSLFGEYTHYVFMNILGMMGISCYILADTFFVSAGLGANGLAALNLALPVYSFIHGTGLMLGMGGATRYSILRNQRKVRESNEVYTHTIVLTCAFAIFFCISGLFFSKGITTFLGADAEIFLMCETYLKVLLLYSPAFLLNDIFLCFVRNDGAPQLTMLSMLIGSISNIIMDYIFIFTLEMGILGAVLATGTAPIVGMLVLSPFFIRKRNHFHVVRCGPSLQMCKYIAMTGAPSMVTELSTGIVMIVFNTILLKMSGNVGVAAYGVIANIAFVVLAAYTGIAQGIQPLISKYYGLKQQVSIKKIFGYATATVVILSVIIYLGLSLGAEPIVAIFNREGNVALQEIAVRGMRLYFTGCLFAGWNIIAAIYLACIDRVGPANMISLLRGFVIILPITVVLSLFGSVDGLWLAFPVTEGLVLFIGVALSKIKK